MTTANYDAEATSALADIAEAGAPVVFLADAWKGGSIATDVTGSAIEIPGDADKLRELGILVANNVTLLVAAKNLGITIAPLQRFTWGGTTYTVKFPTPLQPSGTPILWTVIGVA